MTALLIGATGATGKDLLELLINDNKISHIEVFAKRETGIKSSKINLHIIDFDQPLNWKHLVKGDVLFSCLGTTLKTAGSKEAQKKVDYGYQYQFAKAAKENGVKSCVLVSSEYSSAKSPFFYSKIKGELEEDVKKLHFNKLIIFNPPILIRKDSDRKAEVISVSVIKLLNYISILKSFKPLPTEILAKALVNASMTIGSGEHSIKGDEIFKLAKIKKS